MKKEQTIQVPNYKDSGIGFTTTPTCVMENPHRWGLDGNSFRLWAYLISRIKKEQFFNGRTIKTQLQGTMGQSAVSKGLKHLCDLGFCTKRPNRDARGQMAGYSYTFYAISKKKELVAKVDPKICEKLEAIGWFDLPCDGNPSHKTSPCDGFPSDGEAPTKGKDENRVIEKNKGISPNPLSEKEGDAGAFNREDQDYSELPEAEACTNEPTEDDFRPGRWRRALQESPLGSRFLKMLLPTQIPDDMALRPMSSKIKKGQISPAYLTFIEEKLIRPNRIEHESIGSPLYSLSEIHTKLKSEAYSIHKEPFAIWRKMKFERLNDLWKRCSREFDEETFHAKINTFAAEEFHDEFRFEPDELLPDEDCYPSKLLVYLMRCQNSEDDSPYDENKLIQILHNESMWTHLIDQGAESWEQFHSLDQLCQILHDKLPIKVHSDMQELRTNYPDLNQKKLAKLKEKFIEMGAKPPAI